MSFTQAVLGNQVSRRLQQSRTPAMRSLRRSCSRPRRHSLSPTALVGSALAAGASCTATIVFTTNRERCRERDTDGQLIGFRGFLPPPYLVGIGGAAGSIQIQPSSLTFASTGVGTTSAAQSVLLTNNGAVSLPSLALSVSAGFKLSSTTCAAVRLIQEQVARCRLPFSPTIAGQQSGILTVSSSALPANATARSHRHGIRLLVLVERTIEPDGFERADGGLYPDACSK